MDIFSLRHEVENVIKEKTNKPLDSLSSLPLTKQAEKVIEELKINTENIRKHLEIYHQSLPICENLVKQLNSGVLPQLVKPN